ncbi:MAG: UbiA family prenyltransferase [Planctomycetaceae bacterium]
MSLRAYLQLVRLPAVFSAAADVLMGCALAHGSWLIDDNPLPVAWLSAASVCLYLAGMVFNDVFDRDVDARERPQRPIPSGRVTLRAAVLFGAALTAGGVAAAGFVGANSLIVAGLLVAAILAYDGGLKTTPLGPVTMGLCRALNVLLGASAVADFEAIWVHPQVTVAACYGAYIAGLTWFARNEAGTSTRRQLVRATVVINAGLIALAFLAVNPRFGIGGRVPTINALLMWVAIAAVVNRGMFAAVAQPSPQHVQRAVRTMLRWLVMLDAVLIFAATGSATYALATAALTVPAFVLAKWIEVT